MFSADAKDKSAREMIFAVTNPKNMAKVEKVIGEEIGKFLKDGVSASELDEGKKAFVESQKVQRSSDATLASQLVNGLNYDRSYLYYADLEKKLLDLQPGDVMSAVKKMLDPAKLVIIEAGDFNKK
jgi:zinc protease